jgi:molybdate transport system substrate-binding protein
VLIAHGRDAAPVDLAALPALLGEGRLSMAMVDAVPAGLYGKAALQSLGLWPALETSVVQSDNVRAALAFVATGEAPYGIVYATDAAATDNVSIVATFPPGSHPPILYPAALLGTAADPADRAFFDALSRDRARAIFAAAGFALPD